MPDGAEASAPGRVNLIGEHTDYHDGFVLPTVIPQQTHVSVVRRPDRRIRATSASLMNAREEYEAGAERAGRGWLDYIQGVTWTLARRGITIPGLDLQIASTVPLGAGVSSSAALEIALLRALRTLLGLNLDDVALARIAQTAETDFVGAPVGIMDQIASSLGRPGEALFFDTRTFTIERVPIPPRIELLVIHSGITHAHASGDYVTRRRESFEAAARLGVHRLRDIDSLDRLTSLPSTLARRARHVVTENARVIEAVAALRQGDAAHLGRLFNASHASMRDDYEVSTPEIDTLVAIATRRPDVYGARLTGGGFGGAIVALARAGTARDAADAIVREYSRTTALVPVALLPSTNQ
jgi:galactokinase